MPKTVEEILKSQGYSDADLAGMATILQDQRFRASIESPFNQLETRNDEWQRLHDTDWTPALQRAERDAADARMEAARQRAEREELARLAKDYGYVDSEGERRASEAAAAALARQNPTAQPGAFDPKAHRLVTYDDIGTFAMKEGDAIAVAQDLSEEYRYLTGKSLREYEGANGTRGMRALLNEARGAKQDIDVYVSNKFNFAGKRAEKEAAAKTAWEEDIRKSERENMALKYAAPGSNPMTVNAHISRSPFVPPSQGKEGTESKPVWLQDRGALKSARIQRATERQIRETVQ